MQQSEPFVFEAALSIALSVHSGQVDKAGEPYILHAIRVALRMPTPALRVAAVLHDVLEDVPDERRHFIEQDIRAYFGEGILGIVQELTRGEENYEQYIERVACSPRASTVKLADLEDNLDQARWNRTNFMPPRQQRLRYLWAQWFIRRVQVRHENESLNHLCKTTDPEAPDPKDIV